MPEAAAVLFAVLFAVLRFIDVVGFALPF